MCKWLGYLHALYFEEIKIISDFQHVSKVKVMEFLERNRFVCSQLFTERKRVIDAKMTMTFKITSLPKSWVDLISLYLHLTQLQRMFYMKLKFVTFEFYCRYVSSTSLVHNYISLIWIHIGPTTTIFKIKHKSINFRIHTPMHRMLMLEHFAVNLWSELFFQVKI